MKSGNIRDGPRIVNRLLLIVISSCSD